MEPLSFATQMIFYVVFAGTLLRSLRTRSSVDLAVAAIFGTMAAIFGWSILNQLAPETFGWLRPAAIGVLLLQPVLVFWLVHLIRPLARWVVPAAAAGFIVATLAATVPGRLEPPAAVMIGIFFIVAEGSAAVLLVGESRRRYGLARVRLSLAALGTLLFAAAVFIASVATAAAGPAGQAGPAALLVSRLAALMAALAYLAAFVPPRWLRNLGQRAVAFDLARTVVTSSGDPGRLWRRLALAARDILGAREAVVTDLDGVVLGSTDEAQLAVGSSASLPAGPGPTTSVLLPLDALEQSYRLVAMIEGRPLFIEDDLSVLGLLGSISVGAVEREQALLGLSQARHELAAAEAIKASEARFRALLAADPNAILAVDDDGRVSWATGTTGAVFGLPAEQLLGRSIADMIIVEPDGLYGVGTGDAVRRGHATGRRADGTEFPADLSWSSFEIEGEHYRLAIISDASWREEANMLRDRFLGVLSHELRTPITSIYGGTQLLLNRGRRLEAAQRDELLAGVAAEAERLQRIIENLLVLARVERGADFFDRRPVALKPLLRDVIRREQQLWPHLSIELNMPTSLPLVAGDDEYLELVTRNLISNAGKYAGAQAGVDIDVEVLGGEVIVRVGDDGPGLRDEDTENLFSLYYRSPTSAGEAPGAGIGLFVCRGLVTAMGGRMWAAQRAVGGAEFGFSLPIYDEADALAGADEPATPAAMRG